MQKQEEMPKQIKTWQHFVSGQLGSFISVTICHPLEVARTRLNLQVHEKIFCILGQNATISVNKYNGFLDALKKIRQDEGYRGYYKGYRVTCLSVPLFYSLFFSVYHNSKTFFKQHYEIEGFYNHLISSIVSGILCDFLTNPLWLIRLRIQAQFLHDQHNIKYTGLVQACKLIVHEEGFLALYKGLGVSMFGLSHVAVQFPTYEKLKEYRLKKKGYLTSWDILQTSVLSKLFACLLTYPHVVIRSRLYDNRQDYSVSGQQKKVSLRDIVKEIMKKDGLRGFYFGLRVDILRVLPMNAITFIVYEKLSKHLCENY